MYRPSDLRHYLESLEASPKKSLSQNFLIDKNIIDKMLRVADVQPGETILEIGPGPGALTEQLLDQGAHVIAVEMDRLFAKELYRFNPQRDLLQVICEDVLKADLEKVISPVKPVKVIANLPYHLTTPIITQLAPKLHLFSRLILMVQEEVARRLTANPGGKDWSSISVFLNYFTQPQYAFRVSRKCYYPQPKIDSAIITLDLKEPPAVSNPKQFFQAVRTAFGHRRKMLRSSLRDLFLPEKITEALIELSLNPEARPEILSLEQWIELFESLQNKKNQTDHPNNNYNPN